MNASQQANVALTDLGRFDEVIVGYEYLFEDGYEPTAYCYASLANAHLNVGNPTKAKYYLSLAYSLPMKAPETLLCKKVRTRLLATDGKFEQPYESAMDFAWSMARNSEPEILKPKLSYVAEEYHMKSKLKQAELEKSETRLTLIIMASLLVVLISVIAILFQRMKLYKNMALIEKYALEEKSLKDDLSKSADKLNKMKLDAEAKDSKLSELTKSAEHYYRLREYMHGLFASHIETLEGVCQMSFRNSNRNDTSTIKQFRNGILDAISGFKNKNSLERIINAINEYDDGWFNEYFAAYPNLSENERMLSLCLYLRFKTETIMVLMDKKNAQQVHQAKYKLKKKIQAKPETAAIFMGKLGMEE